MVRTGPHHTGRPARPVLRCDYGKPGTGRGGWLRAGGSGRDGNGRRVAVAAGAREADADPQFERIHSFGARSFPIWDPRAMRAAAPFTAPNAGLVWDSGDEFEQITASVYRAYFNASNSNETRDDRNDNKGPEPEGITVGRVGPRDYAFVGLERIGALMVYDVTNPREPQVVQYLNTRRFGNDALPGQNDSGAVGVSFVAAEESPTGRPLLLVGNEVSQTLAVFDIEPLRPRRRDGGPALDSEAARALAGGRRRERAARCGAVDSSTPPQRTGCDCARRGPV